MPVYKWKELWLQTLVDLDVCIFTPTDLDSQNQGFDMLRLDKDIRFTTEP